MLKFLKFALGLGLLLQTSLSASCEFIPFPPMPPSPQEFSEPVLWYREAEGFRFSWQDVQGEDGYFVFLCNGNGGYQPVATEYQGNSISLRDFSVPGEHFVQIKAFVNVDGNYIFNTGAIARVSVSPEDLVQTKQDEPVEQNAGESSLDTEAPRNSVDSEIASEGESDASEDVVRVHSSNLTEAYPALNGNRSFYSQKYPQVVNPMSGFVDESGQEVKALLTDEGITRALRRVQPSMMASATPVARPNEIMRDESSATTVEKSERLAPQGTSDVPVPVIQVAEKTSGETSKIQEKPVSAAMPSSKDSGKKPASQESVKDVSGNQDQSESEQDTPGMPNSLTLFAVIFAIICLLYFIFSKEEK